MIVPSIDIMNGEAVQLIGGKVHALTAGDPRPLAEKFGRVGEIAVIDLDAALGRGSNKVLIREILKLARCRVGGGIRDVETAIEWLDAGAAKVILGTAATPEVLSHLPPSRTIAALDAVLGEVVDHGWTRMTGVSVFDRIQQLREVVGGFLITFVEREGRMSGIEEATIQEYLERAGKAAVTIAGGIQSAAEIATLDGMRADAQVGMALYTGKLSLAECFVAPLNSDRADGLWPTIVANEAGQALGLVYSNTESVGRSLETGKAHYWSRRRGLWCKGESSGATQSVQRIDLDCDRDTLRYIVRQFGVGFCHLPQTTCFGDLWGITELERTLNARREDAPPGSYSRRLFESPELLASKIQEEADELVRAQSVPDIIHEATDVVFFTLARLIAAGASMDSVDRELDRRSLKVTRRD